MAAERPRGLGYLAVELPRRLLRRSLCVIFGLDRWHVAAAINKPYVMDVIAFLNQRRRRTVVEVGCGLCDVVSHVAADRRIGLDIDRKVVRAARVYTALKLARVELGVVDLLREVPKISADAWVLVGWLHAYPTEDVSGAMRKLFEDLEPGGEIILDTINRPGWHHHRVDRLFGGLHFGAAIIGDYRDARTVHCITKK